MKIKNLLVLLISFICLCACSKKSESEAQSESSSPIMAIVDEAPQGARQEPFRDPMQNIVVNSDSDINAAAGANNMAQSQNLAGDIPPADVSQPVPATQDAHFANPMDRVVTKGTAAAMAPTLKEAAAGDGRQL